MALPVILVDSATGSDTQASGAGPATALFGTTDASTDGTGLIVTLTAGTDLTNVAVDGSHVIYLADATAGNRNFGKITAKAGSGGATPTVTVSNAFGLSLTTKSWAIGGKRASIGSTTSSKLYNNNSAAGDLKPGWIVEFSSGHAEAITATFRIRCVGDTTTGPIVFRAASGYATMPEISVNVADYAAEIIGASVKLSDIAIKRTGSCTYGVVMSGSYGNLDKCKIYGTANFTNDVVYVNTASNSVVSSCTILNAGRYGIHLIGDAAFLRVVSNYISGAVSHGINVVNASGIAIGNIIVGSGGDGINHSTSSTGYRSFQIIGNTINGNTGDGIEITTTSDASTGDLVLNNILSNNGAYGLNMSGASDVVLSGASFTALGNQTYNNTSGAYKSTTAGYAYNACPWASGDTGLNPTFTNSGAGDYSIGTNLKAQGYPLGGTLYVGKTSTTYSYIDPGAAQRVEPAGGGTAGGLLIGGNLVQ